MPGGDYEERQRKQAVVYKPDGAISAKNKDPVTAAPKAQDPDYNYRTYNTANETRTVRTTPKKEKKKKSNPDKILADITNKSFEQYEEDFKPVEEELISEISSDQGERDAAAQARLDSRAAFDRGMGRFKRRVGRGGIGMSAQQQSDTQKQAGLAGARTEVGSANLARRGQEEVDIATRTDLVLAGQGLRGQALQGLGQAATMQGQREAAGNAMDAQKKSSMMGSIGAGAGMGFAMGGGLPGAAVGAGIGLITSLF